MDEKTQEKQDNKSKADNTYTAKSIQVLDGLKAVRKRPAMYIGDTSVTGLHHLVYEVVDNSIDEALAGHCDSITITIKSDGSVTVRDNGRGIPVDLQKDVGKSAVEVVMTTLHAGGKFDNAAYKVSGGLHGVGVSCVNALSEWLKVEVFRDGRVHSMSFKRGMPDGELVVGDETTKTGTRISFKPDPEIFETTSYSHETIAKRMRELAFLNKGVKIKVIDERSGKEDSFHYEGGIAEFVEYINQNKTPLHKDIIYITGSEGDVEVELAMQYFDGYNENIFSFVNTINTAEGGTHLSGFRSALTRTLNQYARKEKLVKDGKFPSGDDFREGLTAILSVKIPDPQFESQTKIKLGNREVQGIVEAIVNEQLGTYLEENPSQGKTMVNKALLAARARDAARKAKDLVQRKGALASGNLPGKLADCSSKNVHEAEMYIVEGQSAGGTAKMGRDRRFQAILPIRGKILNVEKARIDKMLNNTEVETIVQAVGTGIGAEDFDISKARYGKIVIMTDADVDGSHIRTLLLTFFFRHMSKLIEEGYVYIAQPPLYKIKRKKKETYVLSEGEMQRHLLELGMDGTTLSANGTTFEDESLSEIMDELSELEEYVGIIQKKGVSFDAYLELKRDGRLPNFLITRNGHKTYAYSEEEKGARLKEIEEELGREVVVFQEGNMLVPLGDEDVEVNEMPEAKAIAQLIEKIKARGISLENYNKKIEGVKFVVESDERKFEVHSLKEIIDKVRDIGAEGIEITRYKGLGEMNPEQLWETTMDPDRRTLLKVKMEDAVRADMIFTILMGAGVEPRREFIQKYALEVKNLDV